MWSYNYPDYPDYIEHFGIKGQKWGVRRFQSANGTLTAAGKARYKEYKQDKKIRRKLNRENSAARKNLNARAYTNSNAAYDYQDAEAKYRKAAGGLYLRRSTRKQRMDEAQGELDRATKRYENTQKDLRRAERIYDDSTKALTDQVNKMVKKYGSENVKALRTKDVSYGEDFVKTQIRNGITVVSLPIIGDSYRGRYISRREEAIRRSTMDKKARKREEEDY